MAVELAASCRGVTQEYRTEAAIVHALRGVDLDVEPGVLTVIAGPSGSGKSSLLRLLACIDRPTGGSVHLAGVDVSAAGERARRRLRRQRVGYVFQRPADNLVPYLRAGEHIELAARLRGCEPDLGVLRALGLEHRIDHFPHELSGGEQQRLGFASTVVGTPAIVVADEPTAELDSASAAILVDALLGLRDRAALVVASHEPVMIAAADRVIHVADGRVVA